jgi:3-oxoacyl-[acyl-carrier protein] reductase
MSRHVALVTGGSRGIGRAIALGLAEDGHRVVVCFRREIEEAKTTVSMIESGGGEALLVQADVGVAGEVDGLFAEIEDAFGPVGVLVNNAGIRRDGLSMRISTEDWRSVLETNLDGAFLCSKRALRSMVRERWGRIVNVSSVAGLRGSRGQANYSASKAGLIGLTRTVALEVASRNVTVNAVAPGLIATELTRSLPDERYAELEASVPMKRAGTAEEVAAVVRFLCSPAAAYVSGAVVTVDGAMSA